MLRDAWGRSMTTHNSFIPKHPLTSPTRAPSCQGGCRGFDPRFPLQQTPWTQPPEESYHSANPVLSRLFLFCFLVPSNSRAEIAS